MLETASMMVVATVGLYLVALGVVAIVAPSRAQSFLLGFADSPAKHYTELVIRFVAGGGLIVYASRMRFTEVFLAFGWILLITTLVLLLMPWRWHDQFARRAVPVALRYVKLIGISSVAMGTVLLYSMVLIP